MPLPQRLLHPQAWPSAPHLLPTRRFLLRPLAVRTALPSQCRALRSARVRAPVPCLRSPARLLHSLLRLLAQVSVQRSASLECLRYRPSTANHCSTLPTEEGKPRRFTGTGRFSGWRFRFDMFLHDATLSFFFLRGLGDDSHYTLIAC